MVSGVVSSTPNPALDVGGARLYLQAVESRISLDVTKSCRVRASIDGVGELGDASLTKGAPITGGHPHHRAVGGLAC